MLRLKSIAGLCFGGQRPLTSIFEIGRAAECGDPRDRIYGLLSLVPSAIARAMDISPDYLETTAAVYTDFARRFVRSLQSLNILTSARLPSSTCATDTSGLPSWAPDWSINPSRRQQTYLRPASSASGGLRPNCSFPSDRTMRVTGIILGKADTVSPCRLGEEDDLQPERMASAELEVIYRCKPTSKHVYNFYRGQSLALEAYCRILQVGWCRDDFVHDMDQRPTLPSRSQWRACRGSLAPEGSMKTIPTALLPPQRSMVPQFASLTRGVLGLGLSPRSRGR